MPVVRDNRIHLVKVDLGSTTASTAKSSADSKATKPSRSVWARPRTTANWSSPSAPKRSEITVGFSPTLSGAKHGYGGVGSYDFGTRQDSRLGVDDRPVRGGRELDLCRGVCADELEALGGFSPWFDGPVLTAAWALFSGLAYLLLRRGEIARHAPDEIANYRCRMAETTPYSASASVCASREEKRRLAAATAGFALTISVWVATLSFLPEGWFNAFRMRRRCGFIVWSRWGYGGSSPLRCV